MRHYRVALVHCLPAFMMCALLTCTLSCRHEEKLASYLDSLRMIPPIDEPSSFEIVGYRGYGSATAENTLTPPLASPKTCGYSLKLRLEVTMMDVSSPLLSVQYWFFLPIMVILIL